LSGNKRKGIIILSAIIVFFAVLLVGLAIYTPNIEKAFGQPSMVNAQINAEGFDFSGNYCSLILKNEWEFFYNQWIVTDNLTDAQPDGAIYVPGTWAGKIYNGEKLPNTGYASYRCYVQNVEAGEQFIVSVPLYSNAYRAFINCQKVSESGTLSKNVKETVSKPAPQEVIFYTVEQKGDLEIVLEISANRDGGLFLWPNLINMSQYNRVYTKNSYWFGNITTVLFCAVLRL